LAWVSGDSIIRPKRSAAALSPLLWKKYRAALELESVATKFLFAPGARGRIRFIRLHRNAAAPLSTF
jgi:hypothetical protein